MSTPAHLGPLKRLFSKYAGHGRRAHGAHSGMPASGGTPLEVEAHTLWQVVGQCPSALMLVDASGEIQYVNQNYTDATGYAPEDIKGWPLQSLLADEGERARLRRVWDELLRGEKWSGEQALIAKNGQIFRGWAEMTPVRRFDGRISGFFCTLEEITQKFLDAAELDAHRNTLKKLVHQRTAELQHALEMIRANEERYSIALEATQEGIWDWNLQTDEFYCNQAFFNMLDHEREDFPQNFRESLLNLVHPDEREMVWRTFCQARSSSEALVLEYRMLASDGSYKWIMCRARVVSHEQDGAVERIVGAHSDLTLRKQFEFDLLKAKESAEAANQAKSRFLANMSHELRTPLNAVIGMTFLIQRGSSDPVLLERLSKIGEAGQHLLGVISNILDMSKIEAGKMVIEEADFETRHLMKRVENMVLERAASKQLALKIEIDPQIPPYLKGDALRLGQILLNYANNAIKFTERGTVTIACRLLEDSGESLKLHFSVSDTGIGLTDEQRKNLFQSFQQADESVSRKFGGTGLGLAISKQLVALMRGEVGAESEYGKGSTFWFTARLGRGSGPGQSAKAAEPVTTLRSGAQVLLVDDNEINREIASEILESAGLMVEQATDGADALAKLKEARFDAVLMDVQMPVMDGLEATRRIRKTTTFRDLPIIAMTANAFEEDRQECRDAGMNDYLTKPVSPASLYATLARWIPQQVAAAAPAAPPEAPARAGTGDDEPVNVVQGLEFCDGRVRSYHKLLGRFCELKANTVAELRRLLADEDFESAMRLMHSLKGVAATLGARPLADLAAALELQIHHGGTDDALDASINVLAAELQRVLARIGEIREAAALSDTALG